MSSFQEKAQQEQAKETKQILEAAVEGLPKGSPERKAAFKKALDGLVGPRIEPEERKPIWDFSEAKAQPEFVKNESIIIRPPTPSDADFYVNLRAEYSLMYRGILKTNKDINDALLHDDLCKPRSFYCIIEEASTGVLVGYIGIKDTGLDVWEIAIELDRKHTKQGLGPQSIRLFLNEVHRITGHEEFRAVVETDNAPSQKCFERLGATLVGLVNGPILKLEDEKRRFEDTHLDLIDDNIRALASRLGVEPRMLLSNVLDFRLTCPL